MITINAASILPVMRPLPGSSPCPCLHKGIGTGLGQGAHASDIGLAFSDRDHAARVQQVEDVAGLDRLIIGGVRHDDALAGFGIVVRLVKDRLALGFGLFEMAQQHLGVGHVEIPARVFFFGLLEHVAIGQRDRRLRIVERHVHHVIDRQNIHRQTFQTIGQLARDGAAVVAPDLLEIGELRHFHAVTPDFPAQPPSAQRRAFPVVLDKADVVQAGVDADGLKAAKVQLLQIGRAGFDQHLVLIVVLQAVRVLAITPVGGTARGLNVCRGPWLCAQRPQGGCRVECARAHFHVIGLQDGAAFDAQ